MLCEILGGQPVCKANHPSHTVAHVNEKHITANQSSELTIPLRNVGNANAASTALGTAIRLYSGSKTFLRKSMNTKGVSANISGTQMCGALVQSRQRHNAKSAKGQVGHKNQGKSRSMLNALR